MFFRFILCYNKWTKKIKLLDYSLYIGDNKIETNTKFYDIAFIGHYTKDTIISASGIRVVDGGAFNYGANVAARMGLKVAAVTRLAEEDFHVVEKIQARAIVVGASMRDEVSLQVIEELSKKRTTLSADVQSFIRVNDNGKLVPKEWPERNDIFACLDILKTDAVEAGLLFGNCDLYTAAQKMHDLGPKEVIITHREGLLVFADGKFYQENFFPKEIIGRSGRGDTCIASYTAKRLSASPQEATTWAAAVTSLKMEAEGPLKIIQQV